MSPPSPRTSHEHIRVSPDERETVRAAARVAGIKPAEFVRRAATDRAAEVLANAGDDDVVIGLVLPPEKLAEVDLRAQRNGCTRADVVTEVLDVLMSDRA